MSSRKISEFPHFHGKDLLLDAQKRGLAIFPNGDGYSVLIMGLAQIIQEIKDQMPPQEDLPTRISDHENEP